MTERTLGLDLGTKTIGVALSDGLGLTAQPLTTLVRRGLKQNLKELQAIIDEHGVERVLIGLPLNMNGTEGPRAVDSRQFAGALHAATGLLIELWDERLSTVAAERMLIEADLSRKKRREVIDQVAAAFILQGFLDAQRPSGWDDDG